jgi:hypothetical protein
LFCRSLKSRSRPADVLMATDRHGKWKSVLDGSSWAEKETAKLKSEEVGDMNRTKLMWRLVTYMRQGNNKAESLRRLKASLKSGPDRSAPLAIVTRDEV